MHRELATDDPGWCTIHSIILTTCYYIASHWAPSLVNHWSGSVSIIKSSDGYVLLKAEL